MIKIMVKKMKCNLTELDPKFSKVEIVMLTLFLHYSLLNLICKYNKFMSDEYNGNFMIE